METSYDVGDGIRYKVLSCLRQLLESTDLRTNVRYRRHRNPIVLPLNDMMISSPIGVDAVVKILEKAQNSRIPLPVIVNRVKRLMESKNLKLDLATISKKHKQQQIAALLFRQNNIQYTTNLPITKNTPIGERIRSRYIVVFFETLSDYLAAQKAISNGKQWIEYLNHCNLRGIKPDKRILEWIPEFANQTNPEKPPFMIDIQLFHKHTPRAEFEALGIFLQGFKNIWSVGFSAQTSRSSGINTNHLDKLEVSQYNFSRVQSIIVSDNQISYVEMSKQARIAGSETLLSPFLHYSLCLLISCGFQDVFLSGLLRSLQEILPSLITLNLSNNKLTDGILPVLCSTLCSFPFMETLDLQENYLTGTDSALFAQFLLSLNLRDVKDEYFHGLKLILSKNHLRDSIIQPMIEKVVFAKGCQLFYVDLSYNLMSSYGRWRLFISLLKRRQFRDLVKIDETLVVNLYPLPFNQDILSHTVEYFYMIYTLKVVYDERIKREKHNIEVRQNEEQQNKSNNNSNLNGSSFISAVSTNAVINQDEIVAQEVYANTEKSLSFIIIRRRYQPEKRLPYKRYQLKLLALIITEIAEVVEKVQDLTVEELVEFCQKITSYEFEVPLIKLNLLHEMLFDKISEAILIRDHYAVSQLQCCCALVGIDQEMFSQQFERILHRRNNFQQRLEKFLDFEVPDENEINKHLDELVEECIRLDLRGSAIDLLLLIKEKRDQLIFTRIDQNQDL